MSIEFNNFIINKDSSCGLSKLKQDCLSMGHGFNAIILGQI